MWDCRKRHGDWLWVTYGLLICKRDSNPAVVQSACLTPGSLSRGARISVFLTKIKKKSRNGYSASVDLARGTEKTKVQVLLAIIYLCKTTTIGCVTSNLHVPCELFTCGLLRPLGIHECASGKINQNTNSQTPNESPQNQGKLNAIATWNSTCFF